MKLLISQPFYCLSMEVTQMTLHKQIIGKFRYLSHDKVLRDMGYFNLKSGHKTLQKFLDTADIYIWLKKGNYDLKYSSEQFIEKLIETLDLTSIGRDELNQYYRRLDAISMMRKAPYIFVDTHFKRANQPIFSLGFMEGRRNIGIDKELLVFKNEKDIFETIGKIVKNHYITSNGKLPLWGKIYNYVYHDTDGKKIIFNPNGTLSLDHHNITENRAELRIGNQKINIT